MRSSRSGSQSPRTGAARAARQPSATPSTTTATSATSRSTAARAPTFLQKYAMLGAFRVLEADISTDAGKTTQRAVLIHRDLLKPPLHPERGATSGLRQWGLLYLDEHGITHTAMVNPLAMAGTMQVLAIREPSPDLQKMLSHSLHILDDSSQEVRLSVAAMSYIKAFPSGAEATRRATRQWETGGMGERRPTTFVRWETAPRQSRRPDTASYTDDVPAIVAATLARGSAPLKPRPGHSGRGSMGATPLGN